MTRYEILIKIGDERYYLDSFQYDPISLNFDIANIKDISGRNSAYSKTIRLPDSQNNREVLGFITNLSVDSTVDANKAIKTWVLVDTIPVFEGNLQLKRFQKNFKTGEFDIEVVIFADNDTFFTTIGEKYINELDLSAYDHDWTVNNIRFSWTQSAGFPWRYPLIDYGSNWDITDLNGTSFPGATQGTATQSLTADEMFPVISRKIIFDRIFQEAGFNYQSNFLDSDYFKNEYIPFSGVKLPGRSDAKELVFKAAGTSSQSIVTVSGNQGQSDTIIESNDFEDPNNFWDDTNYWYENTTSDTLSISFDILVKYQMILPLGVTRIRVWSSLNADGSPNANWATGTGRLISNSSNLYYRIQAINPATLINTIDEGSGVYVSYYSTLFLDIVSGEKIRFTFYIRNLFYIQNLPFVDLQLSNISNNINPFASVGGPIRISSILPKKIKQKDFILSACREYNLYIEPSKEYENTLIIEPRDDYYDNGQIKDWTNKLDLNSPIDIDILAETQNKITTFTHKEDKDFLNQNYKQSFNEIYGQYDFDSGNEFAKSNNKKIESIFSPTPLNLVNGSFGLIIPLITKDTLFSYNVDSKGRLDTNIRTLQWGGLVEFNNDYDRINFDGEYVTSNGNFAYPYVGHLDNPYSPTVDNNFGDPIDVYFPNDGLTINNLFNRFWYKTMFELTNKDSRIVTANFYLTPEDIYNFRFNDKIYLFFDGNGQYYKVNKIFDFDPGSSKTTKVQLLRTFEIQVNTFVPKFIGKGKGGIRVPIRTIIGVGKIETDIVDTGNNNLIEGEQIIVNGNSNDIDGIKITVNGDNNVVEQLVSGAIVYGDGNQIEESSENITIFGNGNVVGSTSSFLSNVFIIGNNITSTQSNGIYLGNEDDDIIIGGNLKIDKFDIDATITYYILDDLNIGDGFNNLVYSISIQSDEKILVGGGFTAFDGNTRNRLVRLNSDGTEDTGFYTNLGTGFDDLVRSISIQSDGKILVGGAFTDFNGNIRNRLVRLNSDGTEDTGFYTNLGTGFEFFGGATIWSISRQSDGKILVGGEFDDFNGNTRFRLVRLNSDGTEDTGFYTNLGTGFGNAVISIKVQLDGKILVGGEFTSFDVNTRNHLLRLNSDGTEDTGFYTNLGTGFDIGVFSLEIQSDGLILVGGNFNDFNGNVRNYLVRLNSDGTEDTEFYTNLGSSFNDRVWSIKEQLDAKILVGGDFNDFDGNVRNRLVRLNSDGTEDTGFYNNLGLGFFTNSIYSLELQSDEKILVGGGFTAFDGNTRNGLVRLSELEESKIEIKSDIIEIGMSQSITTFSGQLSFAEATINDVINLNPLSATPSNPIEGTIFFKESVGIKFYDGTVWRTLDFT